MIFVFEPIGESGKIVVKISKKWKWQNYVLFLKKIGQSKISNSSNDFRLWTHFGESGKIVLAIYQKWKWQNCSR